MNNKKVLILGAAGMAGHMIYIYLKESGRYDVTAVCHSPGMLECDYILDVFDTQKLTDIISDTKPDYVINCVGVLVKSANANPANAIYVNAYFPHLLRTIVHIHVPQARIIHISTDCVFSGNRGRYTDSDIKDAIEVYGMTKNLGELINDTDLTLRTSIIGPELKEKGEGLFHWVFSQRLCGKLNGYTKSVWSGITTLELAKVIDFAILHTISGLCQISNNQEISKYNLISLIIREFKLPIEITAVDGIVYNKSLQSSIDFSCRYMVPVYNTMIQDLYSFMHVHKHLYKRYLGE